MKYKSILLLLLPLAVFSQNSIKISQLPTAGTITGNELVPIVQSGITKKTTISNLSVGGSQLWDSSSNNLYPVDTNLNVGIGTAYPLGYFQAIHKWNTTRDIIAQFQIHDSLLGYFIPHLFAGFGSIDSAYFGLSTASGDGLLGICDIGYKNQQTQESRHIKMGNQDFDYYPESGKYLVIEAYDDSLPKLQRGEYDFQPHGIDCHFDNGLDSPGVERRYFLNMWQQVPAGSSLTMNSTTDTAYWQPTSQTLADSVTIYAQTPLTGTMYYCTDCSGNGITGRILAFIGGLWRRLNFE